MKRLRMPRAGTMLGVIAVVLALTGTAIAAGTLKLADFQPSSRDRLAGTGVIQYAAQPHTVAVTPGLQTFSVTCELAKKATSGGFKWATPQAGPDIKIHDAYPTGSGYTVRLFYFGATPTTLTVYANCVKSRVQRGTPPT